MDAVRFRLPSGAVYVLFVMFTTAPLANFVPDSVNGTVEFHEPLFGVTEPTVGGTGFVTVNAPDFDTAAMSGFVTTISHFPTGASSGNVTVPASFVGVKEVMDAVRFQLPSRAVYVLFVKFTTTPLANFVPETGK